MPIDANFGCIIDIFYTSVCTPDKFKRDDFPKDTRAQIDMLDKIVSVLHRISDKDKTYDKELYNMVLKLIAVLRMREKIEIDEWQDILCDIDRYLQSVDPSFYNDDRKKEREYLAVTGITLKI